MSRAQKTWRGDANQVEPFKPISSAVDDCTVSMATEKTNTAITPVTHLVQEVELRDVGNLCVEQLISDVKNSLLDGQLDRDT